METLIVNLAGLALIGFIIRWFWMFKSNKG